MEIAEIKKEFQKLSRLLKKDGLGERCGMDERQQAKRTATVRVGWLNPKINNADKLIEEYEKIKSNKNTIEFCEKTGAKISLDIISNNYYARFDY